MKSSEEQRQIRLICLVLALGTFFLYCQTLGDEFISLDDPVYVSVNGHVQKGLGIGSIVWAFDSVGYAGNWHPITWMSHMLDCTLFGVKSAAGHHLTNVLLHTANTVLLFILLNQMTGALWRSAAVAALFAWHPLHVESVAWIAERKDVLSAFFWFLTMLVYVAYVRQSKIKDQRSKISYALVLVCFALALMSKPMVVTLPFVLLLMDFWPLKRITDFGAPGADSETARTVSFSPSAIHNLKFAIVEKLPMFVLVAISCALTIASQKKAGAVSSLGLVSFQYRVANAMISYVRYLGKMIWPMNLAIHYPLLNYPAWMWAASGAVLLSLTIFALLMARRRPWFIFGWLWFLGTLVPVIGLVQVGQQSIADRYTYLPAIGIFIVVVWSGAELIQPQPRLSPLAITGSAIALTILAGLTGMQLRYWKNSVTLFTHALEVTPTNSLALVGLGLGLEKQGRQDEAMEKYRLAMQLDPASATTLQVVGLNYSSRGKYQDAIECYQRALKIMDAPTIHYNLGNALAATGKYADAEEQYTLALRGDPDSADIHNNLGAMLLRLGRVDEAIAHFQSALRLFPDFPEAQDQLASIFQREGQLEQARIHYAEAVRLKPDFAHAQLKLGLVMAEQGDVEAAIAHFQKAVSLESTNADAYLDLGAAYAALGNWDQAVQSFETASHLNPTNAVIQKRLAEARSKSARPSPQK